MKRAVRRARRANTVTPFVDVIGEVPESGRDPTWVYDRLKISNEIFQAVENLGAWRK